MNFHFFYKIKYVLFLYLFISLFFMLCSSQGVAKNLTSQSFSDAISSKSSNSGKQKEASSSHQVNTKDSSLSKENSEAIFQQVWKERVQQLSELTSLSMALEKDVMQSAQRLNRILLEEQKEFSRLLSLYQVAYSHPIEQMVIVYRMKQLYERVTTTSSPLLQLNIANNNRINEISRLKKDLVDSEQLAIGLFDVNESYKNNILKKYQQELVDTESSLSESSARISLLLAPISDLSSKLSKTIERIESSLQTVWAEYYATPISFLAISTENIFTNTKPRITFSFSDTSFLNSRLSLPEERHELIYSGRNFLLCFAVFLGMAYWAYNRTKKLPSQWRTVSQQIAKRDWIYVALGCAFIASSASSLGGMYFSLAFLGSLLFIFGIGSLSWKLRSVGVQALTGRPSPFFQMYPPFVIGMVSLYLDLPLDVLGMIWLFLMICFIFRVSSIHKKYCHDHLLPVLETFLYKGSRVFSFFSLFTIIAGYPRFAVLLFLFFFAVVYLMTLVFSCKTFLALIVERLCKRNVHPVYNVIIHSVITPIILFLIAVISFLPWQWAVPGASSLLQKVVTQNYVIGTTNISFSHFIVIILLFFVFRSIIAIGNMSLSHLPEKITNMERGVIPPLKTLWTYGAWTVFVLISLSLFEVSLTSLAVVAGGLSVGIGFGMQNIFNNLVSGLLLIFGRTILVGDTVEVGGVTGKVIDISIRCTTIETKELSLLYVPNSALMSGQFTNCSRNGSVVQRSFSLGVAYGSDPRLVATLFFEAVNLQDKIIKDPLPSIRLENFGDNSLDFTITLRIEDLGSASDVLSQLKTDLLRLLESHSIEIPFPQLDIHVQKI